MAYTTATNILKYFNGLSYTDSEGIDNNISEADVEQFISEQSTVIDLSIGKKYKLPLTNADDLTYVKLVCDKLVVCQIDKILRTFSYDEESNMVRKRNYCKEAKEMLQAIIDGEIPLNALQKSYGGFKYNKTTFYDKDCDCKQNIKSCDDN